MLKILVAFVVGIFSILSQFDHKITPIVFPLIGFALAVFAVNKARTVKVLVLAILAILICLFAVIMELYCMPPNNKCD